MPRIALDLACLLTPETRAHKAAVSARARARAVLARTDWLIVRQIETGKPVPDAVVERRARARALLGGQGPDGGARTPDGGAVADGGVQAPDGGVQAPDEAVADGGVQAPDGDVQAPDGAVRPRPADGSAHGG